MKKIVLSIAFSSFLLGGLFAQSKGMVDTSQSPYVKVKTLGMDQVKWTDGFWADKFDLAQKVTIPTLWDRMLHRSFDNFKIAAGVMPGEYKGTQWQDGDFYKWVEALVATYAVTKDKELLKRIDQIADTIAMAQAPDGYLDTKIQIGKGLITTTSFTNGRKYNRSERWYEYQDHEVYNFGHLFNLACLHYRVTGSDKLLKVAEKAANYLYEYFKEPSAELSSLDFDPPHIPALVELYRSTGNKRYLELADIFVTMKGLGGQTNYQNHIPLRKTSLAEGHAVCATYLYMGALDIYSETGDTTIWNAINRIWDDSFKRKTAITGGQGNIHEGLMYNNPKGSVHEAYGRPYQIHNSTAYNETCANYGGAFWNYRMFSLTGEPKYLDLMEEVFYNNFSSLGLEGDNYYYTNPLRWYGDKHELRSRDMYERFKLRGGICCPASIVRFMCESNNYAYGKDENALWVQLYGSNKVSTKIGKYNVAFDQQTNYPWDGQVKMTYQGDKNADFTLKLRVPAWAKGTTLKVNGAEVPAEAGKFADVNRKWKKGDVVELSMTMKPRLVEANEKVEEARNQATVKYGALTYCVESADLPQGVSVLDVWIPASGDFKPVFEENLLGGVVSINGKAYLRQNKLTGDNLYGDMPTTNFKEFDLKLVPYFVWSNRGIGEMSIFLPVKW